MKLLAVDSLGTGWRVVDEYIRNPLAENSKLKKKRINARSIHRQYFQRKKADSRKKRFQLIRIRSFANILGVKANHFFP